MTLPSFPSASTFTAIVAAPPAMKNPGWRITYKDYSTNPQVSFELSIRVTILVDF